MPSTTRNRSTAHGESPPPGDHTAREKARLEAANEEATKDAARRMSMATERANEVAEHSVHDPKDGAVIDGPTLEDDDDESEEEQDGNDVHDLTRTDGPPPPEGVKRPPAPQPRPKERVADTQQSEGGMSVELLEEDDEIVEEYRIGRVNTDLESVTFGHGNTFNFERGKKYRMPVALYDHLDERGYVWH